MLKQIQISPLRDLSVSRLQLQAGENFTLSAGRNECLFHILVGTGVAKVWGAAGSAEWRDLGGRRDIFSAPPTAVYVGPSSTITLQATSPALDVLIASAKVARTTPSDAGRTARSYAAPALIRPEYMKVLEVGQAHYARAVREVSGGNGPALRLRMGETINPAGGWSSWPHHDPETADFRRAFEEVFLYFLQPLDPAVKASDCWAIQRRKGVFCNGAAVNDAQVVQHGDYGVVPSGTRAIVAGPNCRLAYVWAYLSLESKVWPARADDGGYYA